MMKVLLVMLALLVVGIGVMVAMCQAAGNRLKVHVDELLVACDEARWDDAYGMTSTAFKQTNTQEDLRAYLEPRMTALGAYQGLGSVKGFEIKRGTSDPYDDAITVDVNFERGTYPGTFKFQTEDGDDKIFGITLDVPDSALPTADPVFLEAEARKLVQLFSDGQLVALYQRFSPGLKAAWPAEKFQEELSQMRGALGPFRQATLNGVTDAKMGKQVELSVVFQNATKLVRVNLADARGAWVPVGFFIGTPGVKAERDPADGVEAEKRAEQDK